MPATPSRSAPDDDAVAAIRAGRKLRSLISSAALAPGSRLPAERELAEMSDCSRATIRRALDILEAEGLVVQTSARVRRVAGTAAPTGGKCIAVLGGRTALGSLSGNTSSFIFVAALRCLEHLRAAGCTVLPITAGSRAWPELIEAQGPIDAVVALSDIATHNALSTWFSHGPRIPLVVWAESLPVDWAKAAELDWVRHDHRAGAASLVRTVAARGARRLVVLWWEELGGRRPMWWEVERLTGYQTAAAELGLPPPKVLRLPRPIGNPDPVAAADTERRLVFGFLYDELTGAEPCDAILASDDQMVAAIHAAVNRLGSPALVVGYDHFVAYEPLPGPLPDLTIDQDPQSIGTALADMTLARLNNAKAPPRHVLVGPRMVSSTRAD